MSEEEKDGLVHFACESCGLKIRVPQIHAGKKGKCPKCKHALVIPKPKCSASSTKPGDFENFTQKSIDDNLNLTLLEIPEKKVSFEEPAPENIADQRAEDLRKLEELAGTKEPEPIAKRKLPWFIDIFLYPTSFHGFMILAIIFGIPLLIEVVAKLLGPFGFFISIPGIFVNIVIGLYAYWYIGECIRDSAEGNIRAPDVVAASPGLGEMFAGWFKIIACFVLYAGPVCIYFLYTRNINTIFWSLLAYAIFFFPIGLLAAVMFESTSAFNPFLLIASIFSTFLQYCGLVFLLCTFMFLTVKTVSILPRIPILNSLYALAFLYLLMVMAHLLGRFYFRYQEKLRWEV